MILFSTLITLAGSGVAFFSGLTKILRHKGVALYYQLIVAAAGCLMLGKVYELTNIILVGELPNAFHIGYLGAIGCFLFLFSANYGQMDSLIDSKGSGSGKYRAISMIAPVVLLLIALSSIQHAEMLELKIVIIVTTLPIAAAAYFNLKHIIIPDEGDGFIKAIRPVNIIVLLLELLYAVQMNVYGSGMEQIDVIVSSVIAVLIICMVVFAERGVKQWII